MKMDGLMARLDEMVENANELHREWEGNEKHAAGVIVGWKQARSVVQQHLDHAEEIQAQEDAAAREQEQVPIGTKVYLSAGVIESGDPGYLRRGHDVYFLSAMPSTVHTRDDFSHLDDDGEPGVTDGGVPASG